MAGLFDFVKTIGKKIFGEGDPDPAAKIKAEIEETIPASRTSASSSTTAKSS